MKERIIMEKNMKKMNDKGFSLVELIIVIAILAILVGLVGSQVIPYIEKSRVSKDLSTLDTFYSALQTAIANESINGEIASQTWTYGAGGDGTKYAAIDAEITTLTMIASDKAADQFVSKAAKSPKIGRASCRERVLRLM